MFFNLKFYRPSLVIILTITLVLGMYIASLSTQQAYATYPGTNGKIAYESGGGMAMMTFM